MNLLLGVGFSGGLIAIPILFAIAAFFSYRAYKKTGSHIPLWLLRGSIVAIIVSLVVMVLAK